ncbi:MAG TPA: universal stress protein [Solirubrobacteraceae bacterium]|nr:universal stress protein [Solirubrobacteraceae bacterium]
MFSNILIGVDGTPGGRDAIALASRLAGSAAELTLVHVRAGRWHPMRAAGGRGAGLEREGALELLEHERSTAGVSVALESIEASSPGAGLHELAEQRHADLLVVGSSARGVLGRAMLGDDTRAALNGAPCAVAIAARGYDEHPLPLARIGVAYNGSPESEAALAAARELAAPNRSEVRALQVVSVPASAFTGLAPAAYGETIDLMLAEAGKRMESIEGARGSAAYGIPGEELAAFSGELDMLVVGSRGYGPVKRLVLGSTSAYLERHARCSLLVLPRPHGARAGAAGADVDGAAEDQPEVGGG